MVRKLCLTTLAEKFNNQHAPDFTGDVGGRKSLKTLEIFVVLCYNSLQKESKTADL